MSGFQFKQFYVDHSQCAMKVGTDGIVLGSWAAVDNARNILDIGTGSGLLSLMVAQKTGADCRIVGIDIEPSAAEQARVNASNSPWPEKIVIEQCDLKLFNRDEAFDVIISNPPFYAGKKGKLETSDPHFIEANRRAARHQMSLPQELLLSKVEALLSDTGRFYCILPCHEAEQLVALSSQFGLHLIDQLGIRHQKSAGLIRMALCFSKIDNRLIYKELVIKNDDGKYTQEYKKLCKDYYLHF